MSQNIACLCTPRTHAVIACLSLAPLPGYAQSINVQERTDGLCFLLVLPCR